MLKESIKDLIIAIAEGDSIAIEDSFNTAIASKISDRLDDMRVSVAQNMFGSVVKESFDLEDYSVEELEDFMMSEDFGQLDELSKTTLDSYIKKAQRNREIHQRAAERAGEEAKDSADELKLVRKDAKDSKAIAVTHKEKGDAALHNKALGWRKSFVHSAISNRQDVQSHTKNKIMHDNIADKRTQGLNLAAKKFITKESYELEEALDKLAK